MESSRKMATKKKEKKELTVTEFLKTNDIKVSDDLKEKIKSNNKIKRAVYKAINENPKTIPEIATETNLLSHDILWFISTGIRFREVQAIEKTGA